MTFETSITVGSLEEARGPLLIILVPEAQWPSLDALDQKLGGVIGQMVSTGDFKGRRDQTAILYPIPSAGTAQRIMMVGIGKPADVNRAAIRRGAAVGAKRAKALGVPTAQLWCAPEARASLSAQEIYQVMAEGAAQGAFGHNEFKRPPEEPKPTLDQIELLTSANDQAQAEAGWRIGAAIGAGQLLTRGLQILPPNVCTPTYLGNFAQDLAGRHGMHCTVLDKAAITAEGMGALLAVAQGSAQDPRFIVIEYRGGEGAPIVLVGKGVTFDTGGISIKPAQNMEDMKFDMSGSAAVLGAFEVIGRLRPKINVVGLIPSAENMPSSTAYRPADIVKTHFGKTIEVINTDAEGRLLLVDALSYARKFQPACVLDIATLTGAAQIALGTHAIAVMGNNAGLVKDVIAAGHRAHERAWELPLWDEYRDLLKSDVADIKNSGGRSAGTITGGWFLKDFVDGYQWAHLDIAATAYTDRDDPAMAKGPTGIGVRLFSEFILGRAGA